jgi:hypothetical protein
MSVEEESEKSEKCFAVFYMLSKSEDLNRYSGQDMQYALREH